MTTHSPHLSPLIDAQNSPPSLDHLCTDSEDFAPAHSHTILIIYTISSGHLVLSRSLPGTLWVAPCSALKKSPQRTYKPGFVSGDSEEASPTIIPLGRRLLAVSSSLPGSRSEPDRLMLPVWPCTGWGLPSQASRPACWCALTAPFHPYRESCQPSAFSQQPEGLADSRQPRADSSRGGLLSVALSLILRPVDVIHHLVLRCPDFPPVRQSEPATVQPSAGTVIILFGRSRRSKGRATSLGIYYDQPREYVGKLLISDRATGSLHNLFSRRLPEMNDSTSVTASPASFHFNLKTLLLAVAAVALILAPVQWFGAEYLITACFSVALVAACVIAYRDTAPGWSMLPAGFGVFIGFILVFGLLVFFFHALANIVVCLILMVVPVRRRTFAYALMGTATAVYAFFIWEGVDGIRRLEALRDQYPLRSIANRLEFEETANLGKPSSVEPIALAPSVDQALDAQDDGLQGRYAGRSWALRELHEDIYTQFAHAAGFGVIRMEGISARVLLLPQIPENENAYPIPAGKISLVPARSELNETHRAALLDFADPAQMGYVRSREEVAGFTAHAVRRLDQECCGESHPGPWQIDRLELVSILRSAEPRVYIADSPPSMDKLKDLPTRPLNEFESKALTQLFSQEDVVVDQQPTRIQMVGALRAGKTCLECHEGQRGKLLGAFSYELTPVKNAALNN
jgi:hypothetical protein